MSGKLLVIGDTPTRNTGFACVVRNTVKHWHGRFERIDIWGINYDGWPHEYPYRIFPAGRIWNSTENLMKLCNFILDSDYTHIWVLQDLFLLAEQGFPKFLSDLCRRKKIRLVTYFPVDAPVDPEWLAMVRLSDVAATFTKYGRDEVGRAAAMPIRCHVIPHGVDTQVFRPLVAQERQKYRQEFFPPSWQDKCILVNVNRNERRKGLAQSLQLLSELKLNLFDRYRLYLHCPSKSRNEQIDLQKIGQSLGLKYKEDWFTPSDEDFQQGIGLFDLDQMNGLYNAADMCISTTLGEGWGLSLTEAAAAGLRVVGPNNTSLPEIAEIVGPRMSLAKLSPIGIANTNDNSRLRYAVDVGDMLAKVVSAANTPDEREPLSEAAKETLSWERIAKSWLVLAQQR